MKSISCAVLMLLVTNLVIARKQRSKAYDADFKPQSQYSPLYTGSYALVVGVNNYSDNSWPDLDEANTKDRTFMLSLMREGIYRIVSIR